MGGTNLRPVSVAAEENALCSHWDAYRNEDILLHEYAHAFHTMGALAGVKGFPDKLIELYEEALRQGLWEQTYARVDHYEYFVSICITFKNV